MPKTVLIQFRQSIDNIRCFRKIDPMPYTLDLKPYILTLALDTTLILVGLVGELKQTINTVPMIMGRRNITVLWLVELAKRKKCWIFVSNIISC